MANTSHQVDPNYYPSKEEVGKAHTGIIWKTFFILCGLTAIEFVFAFFMDSGTLRTSIFVVLTIFKAFYIVGEFMHLKHETKSLMWAILVPMSLVLWLMVALISEGSYYYDSVINYFK